MEARTQNEINEKQFSAWSNALKEKQLPAALIDLNAFELNIEKVSAAVQGTSKTIRIATKSLPVPPPLNISRVTPSC